jgi:hypothetical protein
MSQQIIDVGTAPNNGTGDPIRTAFIITNDNFDQLFALPNSTPPTSNIGVANDVPGMYAWSSEYFYYCYGTYNGNSAIWGQVQRSGIVSNGNSNVVISSADSNIVVNVSGVGNVATFTPTGLSVTANITAGNISTINLTAANFLYPNGNSIISTYSNLNVANYLPTYSGNLGNTGNGLAYVFSNNYFYGNGLPFVSYSNVDVAGFLPTYTGNLTANNISITGNISTSGNIISNGVISSGGAITAPQAGSIIPFYFADQAAFPSAATYHGAVAHSHADGKMYFAHSSAWRELVDVSSTQTLTNKTISGVSATMTANVTGGNLLTGGNISAQGTIQSTGNISTAGYFLGNFQGNVSGNLTVPGSNTQVLFNGNGSAAADGGFTYNADSNTVGVLGVVTAQGNVIGGNIVTAGNVTGNYLLGNVAFVTGLPDAYGNSNVANYLPTYSGNVAADNITATGNISGNVLIATGNISGNVLIATANIVAGNVSAAGNIAGNVLIANNITATANVTSGNVSASGNIAGNNINITTNVDAGSVSASGNVTGNVLIANNVTAVANVGASNVVANFLYGNGAFLTGLPAGYTNSDVANYLPTFTGNLAGNNITVTSNVGAGNVNVTNTISATGNITTAGFFVGTFAGSISGNLTVPGANTQVLFNNNGNAGAAAGLTYNSASNILSVTGLVTAIRFSGEAGNLSNITAGNITGIVANATYATTAGHAGTADTAGTVTTAAQPNITSVGTLSSLAVTANISGGNLLTGGLLSSTGAITGAAITGSSLSVSTGTITAGNIVNGNGNGVGNIGSSTTYFNTVFAQATSAQYADLAEKYLADQDIIPGTVVSLGGSEEVCVSGTDMDTAIVGVVSTQPAYIMNDGLDGQHVIAVALTGRVPCRVTGPVARGQMLVSAGNGMARAEINPVIGSVIGKAIGTSTGGDAIIEIIVGKI